MYRQNFEPGKLLYSTVRKLTLEWRKWPLTPSRMTVPSRRVTPMPSKRREMRGRMLEKALKARLPPEAPVMPSRGATSRRSLSLAPCFFRSRSWFSLQAPLQA